MLTEEGEEWPGDRFWRCLPWRWRWRSIGSSARSVPAAETGKTSRGQLPEGIAGVPGGLPTLATSSELMSWSLLYEHISYISTRSEN